MLGNFGHSQRALPQDSGEKFQLLVFFRLVKYINEGLIQCSNIVSSH